MRQKIDAAKRRSVGRPRKTITAPSSDARHSIIASAGRLFRTHGYRGTSIRQIAEEAGLQKASVYYYFASKEEILRTMTEDIMKPSVRMTRTLDASGLSPAARLHYFLYFDIRHICSAPYDYSWLLTVAETRSEKFAEFWRDRERLLAWVAKAIGSGIAAGQFRRTDIVVTAQALFALDEFTVTWFPGSRSMTAAETAAFVADLAIRSILLHQETIDGLRDELSGEFDVRPGSGTVPNAASQR
jgi:AcrR family transcriptional regulator